MILDDIVSYKIKQIEEEKRQLPLKEFENKVQDIVTRDFKVAISKPGINIIAEVKKASPSKGIIKPDFDPKSIAKVYEKISIDAISVLTEKKFFMGSDEYIAKVKEVTVKPVLRKDFIIDEYQIFQAKKIGADAILLIVAVLGKELKSFYKLATELGLNCLIEVHNREELEIALEAEAEIIGINNRDLRDFSVDLKTTEKFMKYIPKETVIVSESGIKTSDDILYLKSIGVNTVLIGETFMRNIEDIESIEKFILKAKGKVY
ncbi:indole-3-glycerol phosphate synthase TrpC [Clostridium sp.]|jgi:indole-3-glycerol phosphate synthase|uniref:indole-3-glycerol phosphate synthase TrpC n=1 Tax=Clostridium sp. TaxID=1506 RepID=UPI0025857F16|nr:indole-3-glycerol phosphate synthase TrpC [Clostridium sp.]MDF2504594.1 trpC [Clostridium sp.]